MPADEDRLTQRSWYTASALRTRHWPALEGDLACDTCVVGGGLSGLSAALALAQRGHDVVLLEAEQVGWGASGRNGGQALLGLGCDMATIAAQLGAGAARDLFACTAEALALIHARRAAFDIDCEWQPGFLHAAVGPRKARALLAWAEQQGRDYGYALQPVGPSEIRQWIDSPRYGGAAYDAVSGHLHPLKYTLGLAQAAARAGVRIHEGSRVVALERDPAPGARTPVVRTARGRVRCRHLLLAGGTYLGRLVPRLDARIMPVGTFIAATAPLGKNRADALIPSRAAVADTNVVLDYFRLSADDRMVFGGRVTYSGAVPPRLDVSMRRRMVAVFPQLADVPVTHVWGGFVDISLNRAPDFGRLDAEGWPDAYHLQGYSGHGLALTGLAGQLVAEAIAGTSARFDLFARLKHRPFPGGRWLRMPGLVLGMAWYRLRDALG